MLPLARCHTSMPTCRAMAHEVQRLVRQYKGGCQRLMLISEPELVLVQVLDNETDAHLVSSKHAAAAACEGRFHCGAGRLLLLLLELAGQSWRAIEVEMKTLKMHCVRVDNSCQAVQARERKGEFLDQISTGCLLVPTAAWNRRQRCSFLLDLTSGTLAATDLQHVQNVNSYLSCQSSPGGDNAPLSAIRLLRPLQLCKHQHQMFRTSPHSPAPSCNQSQCVMTVPTTPNDE